MLGELCPSAGVWPEPHAVQVEGLSVERKPLRDDQVQSIIIISIITITIIIIITILIGTTITVSTKMNSG